MSQWYLRRHCVAGAWCVGKVRRGSITSRQHGQYQVGYSIIGWRSMAGRWQLPLPSPGTAFAARLRGFRPLQSPLAMAPPRQTASYLMHRFREAGFEPHARHGQNFLIDLNLLG